MISISTVRERLVRLFRGDYHPTREIGAPNDAINHDHVVGKNAYSSPSSYKSLVHNVRLSRKSCMINVESL